MIGFLFSKLGRVTGGFLAMSFKGCGCSSLNTLMNHEAKNKRQKLLSFCLEKEKYFFYIYYYGKKKKSSLFTTQVCRLGTSHCQKVRSIGKSTGVGTQIVYRILFRPNRWTFRLMFITFYYKDICYCGNEENMHTSVYRILL